MRVLALVFVVLTSTACLPTHRAIRSERTRLWMGPGSLKLFSWVSTVEHRETSVLTTSKDDAGIDEETSDTLARTALYAIDPVTHAEVRLGMTDGDGGDGVYDDVARGVLWVRDSKQRLSGLGGPGRPLGPAHGRRQVTVIGLEPPFVLATVKEQGALALFDLASDGQVTLPESVARAEVTVDKAVVRFTSLESVGDVVRVHQIAVDWSSGAPQRLPDSEWTTAPLAAIDGTRLAFAMLRDGRYVEVVRGPNGTRLLVWDLGAGPSARPVEIALPSPPADAERPMPHLAVLDGDAVVFGESAVTGERACWSGVTVRVNRALTVPLPAATCLIDNLAIGGHRLLATLEGNVAIVDAEAQLVVLAGVDRALLGKGFATGPTKQVFTRDDGHDGVALVEVDLVTGARKDQPLDRIKPHDRLIALNDGGARFVRGTDTLLTVPLATPSTPTTLVLAAPVLTRADRIPRDRTEFWIGGGGGGGTQGTGVARLGLEIAHWVNDRWTMVGRANVRLESKGGMTDPQYVDAGGSFGYAWHRLPRLWSIGFEADLGANFAGRYVGKERTDAGFAPSAEVHLGAQGQIFGIDLCALMPSMIDLDRGVVFLLNAKFGFTENLH